MVRVGGEFRSRFLKFFTEITPPLIALGAAVSSIFVSAVYSGWCACPVGGASREDHRAPAFSCCCDGPLKPALPPELISTISDNLRAIRVAAGEAHARAGRADALPRLIAVTKYAQTDWIRALHALGERDFGENRPQQLHARRAEFGDDWQLPDIRWHLIGPLQRNKARLVLTEVDCIHSIDSFKLLDHLDRLADELKIRPRLLLQVNVSGEESKGGFSPQELSDQAVRLAEFPHLEIVGLMTMAPYTEEEAVLRAVFRRLRELRERLRDLTLMPLPELSMGMTNDFEIAIEEGATLIRIGSGLFEGLD